MIEVEVGTARIVLTPVVSPRSAGGALADSYSYGDLLAAIRRAVGAMDVGENHGRKVRINNLLDDLKAVTG